MQYSSTAFAFKHAFLYLVPDTFEASAAESSEADTVRMKRTWEY